MDANIDEVRSEVRYWLENNSQLSRPKVEWMQVVLDAGWACPSWPDKWFGKGLPIEASWVVVDEFAHAKQIGAGQDLVNIPACTFFTYGSEDFKARWLRKVLTGEVLNSLLYSEPGAGSDLASLQTRAELIGDHWVVNGQKVWTSWAQLADFGLLAARTNWNVSKHHGITLFWCPLKQPGVEIRPIRQITGESDFNEIFLDEVQVPRENVIGEIDKGWPILRAALAVERVMFSAPAVNIADAMGAKRRVHEENRGRQIDPNGLIELARKLGRNRDPIVRDAIANFYALSRVISWNASRMQVGKHWGAASSAASLGKLATSRLAHTGARIEAMIAGTELLLQGADSAIGQDGYSHSLGAFKSSIAGGSDQIQRNVIGELILGLPREPELDKDVPFRDVLKPSATRRADFPS